MPVFYNVLNLLYSPSKKQTWTKRDSFYNPKERITIPIAIRERIQRGGIANPTNQPRTILQVSIDYIYARTRGRARQGCINHVIRTSSFLFTVLHIAFGKLRCRKNTKCKIPKARKVFWVYLDGRQVLQLCLPQ